VDRNKREKERIRMDSKCDDKTFCNFSQPFYYSLNGSHKHEIVHIKYEIDDIKYKIVHTNIK
jgi:hypothetical protein